MPTGFCMAGIAKHFSETFPLTPALSKGEREDL
jgi:hypothetical protein